MNAKAAEGYAIIWKKRKFDLFTRMEIYGPRVVGPSIYTAYKLKKKTVC